MTDELAESMRDDALERTWEHETREPDPLEGEILPAMPDDQCRECGAIGWHTKRCSHWTPSTPEGFVGPEILARLREKPAEWWCDDHDVWTVDQRCPKAGEPTKAELAALVRNPVLGLPAVAQLQALPDDVRATLRAALLELRADADAKAEHAWKKRKGPMAAYWRATSTYAGHFARALR